MIGILGSVLVLISGFVKSNTDTGNLWMRHINNAGSVLFIMYGFMLTAWSTIILNVVMIFVNSYHIYKIYKNREKLLKDKS